MNKFSPIDHTFLTSLIPDFSVTRSDGYIEPKYLDNKVDVLPKLFG